MADDVNKSNKGVNGKQIPKPLEEAISERNRRIDFDYLSNDDRFAALIGKQRALEDQASSISNLSSQYAANHPGQKDIVNAMQDNGIAMADIRGSIESYESVNATKQNATLADRIGTYTNSRNVNQRTTTMSSEQRFSRMAYESPDLYAPTDVLEKRIASGSKELTSLGSELAGRTRGIGTDQIPDSLMDKASRIQELQEDIALNKRMIKIQGKEGLSTEKRSGAASETLNRVGGVLDDKALKADVGAGKYGSVQEESDKLANMFKGLSEALSKFEAVSEDATDAQGNLTKEYKEASAELEKMQKATDKQRKVVDEVERQGGGGNSGSSLQQNAAHAKAMISAGYGIDIDDKITEMRLKAGTGQTAVDQYNRVNAGIGGDMRSILRESTSQDFVKSFSDDMRQKAVRQAAMNTAASAVDTVGGAVTAVGAFDATGATLGIGAGAMNTIRTGSQAYRGLPQTAKALEAYGAGEQFQGVALEIQAQNLQAVYNQQMTAYSASIGRGGSAGATEATLMDSFSLGNFAKQGMTPAQAANLTASAGSAIGGTGSATGVALQASKAQQSRMMSADQFIGMTGQLANAGGSSSDLEEIMKNAVAAGMDNAKNIQQMVSATVSLSSSMAKTGLQGAGASANIVGSMVQSLGGDKNTAAIAAESMVNIRSSMDSNRGLNIGNVFEDQQLRALDPKLSTVQKETLAGLSPQEYEYLLGNGREGAEKMGLGSAYDRSGGGEGFKKFVNKASSISGAGTKLNVGIGVYSNKSDLEEGATLSEDAIGLGYQAGLSKEGLNLKSGMKVNKGAITAEGSSAAEILKTQASREKQTFDSGGGVEAMKQLVVTMQDLMKALSPEKAQERVESSMDSMKVVGSLDKAGDKFNTATANFSKGVEEFNRILKAADMGERQTNVVNNNSQTKKVGGR